MSAMRMNFEIIWTMTLDIVKWYFENGKEEKACVVFKNGVALISDELKDSAYSTAVRKLTKEQMDKVWDFDSNPQQDMDISL